MCKADLPFEKSFDSDLVGSIHDCRHAFTVTHGSVGEREAGEAFKVRLCKGQPWKLGQVKRLHPGRDTLRIGQGIGNRSFHVRGAKLGDDTTVDILDHRMYYALRMNIYIYPVKRQIKEPACLNNLKPFVHHGRRVYRDLASHAPVRMIQGIADCYASQTLNRRIEKRTSGSGQDDPGNIGIPVPLDRLEYRAMLAVYRVQPDIMPLDQLHKEMPCSYEDLLVRKSDILSGFYSCCCGHQPGSPDNGGNDHVGLGQGCRCHETVHS